MTFFDPKIFETEEFINTQNLKFNWPDGIAHKEDRLLQPYIEKKIFFDSFSETFKTDENLHYPWCPHQDHILRILVEHFQCTNWEKIAEIVNAQCPKKLNMSAKQCNQRWHRVSRPGLVKGKWTQDEDHKLYALLNQHPNKHDFQLIAKELSNRSDTQIRYRVRKLYPHYFFE